MTDKQHDPQNREPVGSFSATLLHLAQSLQGRLRMPNATTDEPLVLWPIRTRATNDLLFLGWTSRPPHNQLTRAAFQIACLIFPPVLRDPDRLLATLQKKSIPGVALQPREIIIIPNPTCTPEQPHVPQYYGFYNPGEGQSIHRIPITPRLDKDGYLEIAGHMEPYHPERAAPWQQPHISECNRSTPRPPRRGRLLHELRTGRR